MPKLLLKGNNKLAVGPLYSIVRMNGPKQEYLKIDFNNPLKSRWIHDTLEATIIRRDKSLATEYAKYYHAEVKEW